MDSKQRWINVGMAVGMALALVVAVMALTQVGVEYQEMSLTGIGWMLDGDATDLLVVDQTGTGDVAEFRDDGTVVMRIVDGGLITTSGALHVGSTITATTLVTSYTNLDASGTLNVDGATTLNSTLDVDGATTLNSTLDVDGNVSSGTGLITVTDGIHQAINTTYENVGLPSVATASFTYTAGAGGTVALFTIGDGEIWIVHDIYVNVTTNFDCTGDDCTVHIGDGGDEDGLCDLDDGELQAADVEVTGSAAGWQCFGSADVIGAYIASGRGFIYAPSGSAETIDAVLAASGDDFSAGAATVYAVYTRVQ